MQLITDQDIGKNHGKPMVVALGSFDGVHRGHQAIITETVRQAKETGAFAGVFTFHPHPLKILAPDKAPGLITALPQKVRILSDLGVDCLILKSFTKDFAATDFQVFVHEYLVNCLKVTAVVIGEDFRFGRASAGNALAMEELGRQYGFSVKVFQTIGIEGVEVRSTLIRDMIQHGQVDELVTYLGRPYTFWGTVTHGDGRGRKLGFPTANLALSDDFLIPAYGVYAVNMLYAGNKYPGVANIGLRPTFNKNELSIEIHLIDYTGNLYNETVEVELVKMLRPERLFKSVNELVAQIAVDTEKARQILFK